jgi:hypothetical protein
MPPAWLHPAASSSQRGPLSKSVAEFHISGPRLRPLRQTVMERAKNSWRTPTKDNSRKGEDGFAGIASVKSFRPNGYGLFAMAARLPASCLDSPMRSP